MLSTRRVGTSGFTLIEILVAMAVSAILAALAWPSFEQQVLRVRRTDALTAALQVQLAQERYRGNGASYGELDQIGAPANSAQGHYQLRMVRADADGYEWLATAVGSQERDAACRYLKLSAAGLDVRQNSGPDAALANPAELNRQCWGLR